MGGRRLKQWIREPLNNADEIQERLDAVEVLVDDLLLRNNLRENLKQIYDFERLSGRIACGSANGKDLIALRNSCFVLPEIKGDLEETDSALLKRLGREVRDLKEVYQLIDTDL